MTMSGMSMSMSMGPTATSAMTSSTSMASMDMDMDMGGSCKISMLWNWDTIDACFLSTSWHIKSKGMFAGSCIGVILLVILLEFLRRAGKEYDRHIIAQYTRSLSSFSGAVSSQSSTAGAVKPSAAATSSPVPFASSSPAVPTTFRPNIMQQAIRALLHMLQFAVAYFIMLLAMYFNGYIIISIFIGAYLGHFIFGWETFSVKQRGQDRMDEEVTVCCG